MPPHAVPLNDADTGTANAMDRSPPMRPNAGPPAVTAAYGPYDYARDRDRDRAHRDRPYSHAHAHAPPLPNATSAPTAAASPYAGPAAHAPRYYADDAARDPARAAAPPRGDWRTDPRAGPPPPPYWAAPDPYNYYRVQPPTSYPYPPPPPPHAYAHHARGSYPPPPHAGYPSHPAHAPRYGHAPAAAGGDRRASPAAVRALEADGLPADRHRENGNRDVAGLSLPMTLRTGPAAAPTSAPPRARVEAQPAQHYAPPHRPPPPPPRAGYYPPPPPEHDLHAAAYACNAPYGHHYGYPPHYPSPYGHYPPHPHAHPHAYAPPSPPTAAARCRTEMCSIRHITVHKTSDRYKEEEYTTI
ncbi:hypothetical protein AMAG_13943 [Allomyces macrogynus ATCC 38327]|uniref:Uncharacterized protein n=1 Tax=Allomyces macrogynus (strain ATCC 38327) TaxID=578462 RepID=A0A0L0T2K6_ALLM3|nr:hypothetical protein AMAG_13943 [Allomyces macrogynus ATCC 38327]|eukprot:KNE69073.1 hypothetical protein AMAG_13943 [Allomyces macrogynus ATCC 38327]